MVINLDLISVSDSTMIVDQNYSPSINIHSVGANHTDNAPVRCVLTGRGDIRLRTMNGGTPSGNKVICVAFVYPK